ncbi:MAG TPA: ABC transporter permease [Terriglobales bacterium]|nr:ABC transporter permease [Terriglobales bacterium]
MSTIGELGRRLRMLAGRRRWRRELEEEMRLHRELRADPKRFGNELLLRERSQAMWGWTWLETLGQDVRHALRLLARTPVATGLALLSLTLGIGANAALFSLTDAVLLRSLPVAHPEQLVQVLTGDPQTGRPSLAFTNPMWEQVRDHHAAFGGVFAWNIFEFNLSNGGQAATIPGIEASGEYFRTLGVRPAIGRLFGKGDDVRGCTAVADISDGFWREHFGGAASALGSSLSLDGHRFQVIGVTPAGFFGMDVGTRFDVAVPLCSEGIVDAHPMLDVRDAWWLMVAGRLRPDESTAVAAARLNAAMSDWMRASLPQWPPAMQQRFLRRRASLQPVGQGVPRVAGRYGLPLKVLLAIAGLVLLVACANLAGLMLARAAARRAEIATRLALGASRARLVRQLLTESLLLSGGGTALGAGLAVWACRALESYWSTPAVPVQLNLSLDGRMLAFTLGLTLATGVLVGLAPALRATRGSWAAGARADAGSARTGGERLAVAQVAISLLLLAGAGLFLRSFVNLSRVDLGFDPSRVLLVKLGAPSRRTPDPVLAAAHERDLAVLRALPGVAAAGESFTVPTSGWQWDNPLLGAHAGIPDAYYNAISPGYFATLRTPLLAGRDFFPGDRAGAPAVTILNQTAARQLFPGGNALGQVVRQKDEDMTRPAQVVGIVADAKYDSSLRAAAPPTGYYPLAQLRQPFRNTAYELRTALPAAMVEAEVRTALARSDPEASFTLGTLQSQVAGNLKPERLLAVLSALFGGLALLPTAIGLYGAMAYNVNRRRREFGIRMALGARPAAVVRLALGSFTGTLALGAAAGLAAAWLAARLLRAVLGKLLFQLSPSDWATLAGAAALLAAVALLAGWLPARRAARADPMGALREE